MADRKTVRVGEVGCSGLALCGSNSRHVTLAVLLRWSSLISTVLLYGDVSFSLGKWSRADCGDVNGRTVLCPVSEDGALLPKRLGDSNYYELYCTKCICWCVYRYCECSCYD